MSDVIIRHGRSFNRHSRPISLDYFALLQYDLLLIVYNIKSDTMQRIALLMLSMMCYEAIAQDSYNATNYISVAPFVVTQTTRRGFSVQYEKFIDNKWSITLPISYSFGNSNPCDSKEKTRMLRIYPGIKFYPAGKNHRMVYGMGVSASTGVGNSNCSCLLENASSETNMRLAESQSEKTETQFTSRYEAGLVFNNSITIMFSKHVFIGSDLAIGGNMVGYKNTISPDLAFRFTFNLGYRF